MQDLPPPSYDDAISGAYPSSPKQEPLELSTFSPSAPLAPSSPPSPQPSPSPEPQTPRSSSISLKNKCVRGVLCTVLILVVIAVMATVVKDIIPSPASNCKKGPPKSKIGGGFSSKKHCEENSRGEYYNGSSCVYECTQQYNVINSYAYRTKLNYTCKNSKWIPSVGYPGDYFACRERPSIPEDCKPDLPNIFQARWIKCPRNSHYKYFNGTECKFKCPSDTSLYVYWTDDLLVLGPDELSYTCMNSKWVPSFENAKFQCIPFSSAKDDCTTSPANIVPGAVKIDCPFKKHNVITSRRYKYGTKCRFSCAYIYRGGEEGFVENHEGTITYTCDTSKWISSVGEAKENWQCFDQPDKEVYCKDKPSNITGAHWTHCPKNHHGQYFAGTKCSFSCDLDYVVSGSEGGSNDVHSNGGSYTCTKNGWVSSGGDWGCNVSPRRARTFDFERSNAR